MITSIISEYNPFHNGHKYQILKAREQGAEYIAAIMSGDAVQRGDTAIYSKHFRAKQAVLNGADLVVELPVPFCISSAEGFARAGVFIAQALGSNSLCFGCEEDNLSLLLKAAEFSKKLSEKADTPEKLTLKKLLREGNSYPSAASITASVMYGEELSGILEEPNNILAIEYLKALEGSGLKPMPILRKSAGHNDNIIHGEYACASKIRELLRNGSDVSGLIPYEADYCGIRNIKNMEKSILFSLIKMSREELISVPDINGDLADRIIKALKTARSYDELIFNIKTKTFTLSRIRRALLYAVLGIKKSDFKLVPYIRVLAFNNRGAEILASAKSKGMTDISTSLKQLEGVSENNKRLVRLDLRTSEFARLCCSDIGNEPSEYSVRIEKTNS